MHIVAETTLKQLINERAKPIHIAQTYNDIADSYLCVVSLYNPHLTDRLGNLAAREKLGQYFESYQPQTNPSPISNAISQSTGYVLRTLKYSLRSKAYALQTLIDEQTDLPSDQIELLKKGLNASNSAVQQMEWVALASVLHARLKNNLTNIFYHKALI